MRGGDDFDPAPAKRPGLGTTWGETRVSRISTSPFFREDSTTPSGVASFFYNDEAGVRAMGGSGFVSHQQGVVSVAGGSVMVRLIDESGRPLPGLERGGQTHIVGTNGQRYIIQIKNNTSGRVEAVATVDGLDVIDGRDGSFSKRGYIVNPFSTVEIDGFRQSTETVAAFRFGSVGGSYAASKGKARNVGVIAVAIFAEQAAPQIIVDEPRYRGDDGGYYGDEVEGYLDRRAPAGPGATRPADRAGGRSGGGGADKVAAKRPAPRPTTADGDDAETAAPPPTATGSVRGGAAGAPVRDERCCTEAPRRERLGLGTEFGEQRHSAATYTRFVRGGDRPVAVAELRYNDTAGLEGLGILVAPRPDADELMTRETANPFPGDRFARPPAGIR